MGFSDSILSTNAASFFGLSVTGGCDNKVEDNQNLQQAWYDNFNLETKKVTIYIDDRKYEDEEYYVINITNPDEIALLVDSVNFSAWRKAQYDEQYNGISYFYIVFNSETTIGLYQTVAYGNIGHGIPDSLGNFTNTAETYFMPDDFLQAVQQLVKTHTLVE